MSLNARPARRRGFTLIELLVTIAVLVILATIAVPSFTAVIRSNRAVSEANQLLSLYRLARSEAIRRNQSVSICPTTNGETCAPNASWEEGLMVFVDANRNRVREGEDEPLIQSLQPFSNVSDLTPSPAAFSAGLILTPVGRLATEEMGAGLGLGNITIAPLSGSDEYNKKIVIARSGRAQIE
ncbi:GspH/FimT family pseudopilin [Polycyclovorans algicola]|uniref:GspH/FimT family pseudopilin n=1 Tax=Polycyclovorans algicola TaxID=616992 RepID=UPI0006935C81|nr:GspH/FimT family pseudopilin [Polycyclovorans algicola]